MLCQLSYVGVNLNGLIGGRRGEVKSAMGAEVSKIAQIEAQYLTGMEDEARALTLINEGEYVGQEDDDALT